MENRITHARLKELLSYDSDTGIFTRRVRTSNRIQVGDVAGTLTNFGYVSITLDRARYQAHRLAWLYVYGRWPAQDIDHINRLKSDNRIANLRDVSRQVNMLNIDLQTNNTSGVTGVSWHKATNKWRAEITLEGAQKHLGLFDSFDDAVAVRKAVEMKVAA